MRSSIGSIVSLAILAAACDNSDPSPPEFTIFPQAQWAGGEIQVRSSLFVGLQFIPPITASGIPMAIERIDDSTVVATLPGLPGGTSAIQMGDPVNALNVLDLGSVAVAGFRARTSATPGFFFEPFILTSAAGGPVVVASTDIEPAAEGISIIDLRSAQTGVETGVKPPQHVSSHGVGASFQPGHLILRDSMGTLGDWQVLPTLAYSDSVPNVTFSRQVARLADQVWLFTSNHATTVRRSGAPDIIVQQEDPWGFHFSLPADRALMNSALSANGGSPVFRMSTGDTVYRLGLDVHAAAFTSDGSKLYVVGAGILSEINAATGTLLRQANVPLPNPTNDTRHAGLDLNANESIIFVAAMTQDSIPEVLVYDAATFEMIGRMAAPVSQACPYSNCVNQLPHGAAFSVDDATATAFWVLQGEAALIWEFDPLPEALTR